MGDAMFLLHDSDGDSIDLFDDKPRAQLELFIREKTEQSRAYKNECTARFSKDG